MKTLRVMLIGLYVMVMPAFSADMGSSSQSWLSVAGSAISESGIVSKIQGHIKKNKYACMVTLAGIAAGGYMFYQSFCVAPSTRVEDELISLDEVISEDGRYHWMPIPGLKHLAVAGGPCPVPDRFESQPGLFILGERDSSLNLMQEEDHTDQTFKELIQKASAENKPYMLVRVAFFDKRVFKSGHLCTEWDAPVYHYYDNSAYNKRCKISEPTEIVYIEVRIIDGKFVAQVVRSE